MTNTLNVELTALAIKDLKKLSTIEDEIIIELKVLKTKPHAGHALSQNLQGVRALEFSIKGSGEYRAAYVVQEAEMKITIFMIGTHENFYETAAKRVKSLKPLIKLAKEENRVKQQSKKNSTKH